MCFFSLWDTGENADIRKGIYSRADAVMVCFPVVGYDEEISQTLKYFFDESSKFCKHIFFVGTKTELRAGNDRAIQFKQGKELAKELKGEAYLECSAQDNDGSVEEVFKEVAKRASTGKDQLDSLSLSPKTHNGLRRGSGIPTAIASLSRYFFRYQPHRLIH